MKKVIIGSIFMLFTGCAVIHPGESGVVFNRISGTMRTESQGTVFLFPFVTTVQTYPVSLRTYTMVKKSNEGSDKDDDSIDLPSREGQHIKQDISITYNTTPDKAADVYRSFKGEDVEDIEKTFIRRTTMTVAQNVAGSMSLVELISTKRDDLQAQVQKVLSVELLKMGFTLDKVNLGAAHLPPSVESQMQQKMAAQQDAQRAEYELQKQQVLAKSRIAEAEGQATANLVLAKSQAASQRVLQESITPMILQLKAIEKWSGQVPQVMGSSSNMLFNIPTKGEK